MEANSFNTGPRWPGLVLVIALHVAVVVALLTYQPARELLGISKPVMVEFITPPAPPQPEPPKEQPKPKEVKIVKQHKPEPVLKPQPLIASTAPTPSPMVVEQPLEPPKPQPPVEAAPPPAPAPPAAPATPRTVSSIEYVRQPVLKYPPLSRRLGEQGKVTLRVTVDTQGRPEQVEVIKSSGSPRLDDAARHAMLEALFKPYTENGKPIPASATAVLAFNLNPSD